MKNLEDPYNVMNVDPKEYPYVLAVAEYNYDPENHDFNVVYTPYKTLDEAVAEADFYRLVLKRVDQVRILQFVAR